MCIDDEFRGLSVFFAAVLMVAVVGCSGDEPVEIDACDGVDCAGGLFCESETGDCVCDDTSCGEGRECAGDSMACVDAPHLRCEWGTTRVDGECQCDPEICESEGWRCTDGDRHCVFPDDGECVDGGTDWSGDAVAFEERTDSGLAQMEVQGIRISTADVTGNGYPDLLVRRGLAGADDFSDGGSRQSWLLENTGQMDFRDITRESGLLERRYDDDEDIGRPAEVIALADIDNSGALDAVTLATDLDGADAEGAEVMFNDGQGQFELGPTSEPLHRAGEAVARSGAAFVDVDRDGFVDLWIGTGGPGADGQDRLLRGDGTGHFADITDERGLDTVSGQFPAALNAAMGHANTWAVEACDVAGDGWPELLSSAYGRMPNQLWNAERDGGDTIFENHSVDSGYAFSERDDWTDNESARCYCSHNRDAEDCADVPEQEHIQCNSAADAIRWNHSTDREPYRLGGNTGTTVCADLNNNGRMDLLNAEIVHWDVGSSSDPSEILYNAGSEPLGFERPGNEKTGLMRPQSGVVWDHGDITAAALDFDNSGRLDILIGSTDYPGTRAHLFSQQSDGTFERVPTELGIDLTSAHGIAVADFNRNGSLDVVMGHSRARCDSGDHCLDDPHVRLFENRSGGDNNWIQLELEGGEGSNRAAIGAGVIVATGDQFRRSEVGGGHGHYGMQHGMVEHFGLGDACMATVVIEWPDADQTQEVYRLPAGERYHIRQGERPVIAD